MAHLVRVGLLDSHSMPRLAVLGLAIAALLAACGQRPLLTVGVSRVVVEPNVGFDVEANHEVVVVPAAREIANQARRALHRSDVDLQIAGVEMGVGRGRV